MTNPLQQLKAHGQSVWYDNIDRAQLISGLFQRLIDEDGIVGTTANPTIFEQSISHGAAYDEQIQQLIQEGKSTNEIYKALIMTDIRMVADLLRPIYDETDRQDGFVSLEVSPDLAHDTAGTLAEVRRFWNAVDRPNLMVKLPATPAGIPAIRQALSEGININITLIFSLENYHRKAYRSSRTPSICCFKALKAKCLLQHGSSVKRDVAWVGRLVCWLPGISVPKLGSRQ